MNHGYPAVMDEQFINMLQYAAAVPAPLRIEVTKLGQETGSKEAGPEEIDLGERNTETIELAKPFVVIGRHPNSDIVVNDPAVSTRHVYLQAIGPRIAALDLCSRSGTEFQGAEFSGWLSHEHTIKIPGAEFKLCDPFWVNDTSLKPPTEFRPRDEQREEYGTLPKVELELLNTSSQGKRWPINRVITLIGRDERCRIAVIDSKISRVHCSLLLLPSGLWVIDLTGKEGVSVNGQHCNCAMLAEGTEFQLGPYQLAARYPEIPAQTYPPADYEERPENDFLTQHNRIFQTQIFGDTIVVLPLGDSQAFFYQDIRLETNRVVDVINKRHVKNIVIDFSKAATVGHILVESLYSFCRAVPGKAAVCACTVATYEMLQASKFFHIWPHYQTRQDALQAVSIPD
ncbi:FHA domain-containing protein [Thalassoglobus polymorphus]|uniref:FHA domain protein n=1 Tax=Thalassoglobus polymorphus TaxID=2527994 RepID=A0A517QR62_9PLAN|nr:FHA domain-containing protein [Thalassoglobus polymorphus]QDT34103.1 FHA domain protein [Thalassoglobus polymorphus]